MVLLRKLGRELVPEAIKLWIKHRPIKKWRNWRRTKKGLPPTEKEEAMSVELILLVIRHGLSFVGGASLFTDSELTQIAGAVATVGALLWSAYRKWKREQG